MVEGAVLTDSERLSGENPLSSEKQMSSSPGGRQASNEYQGSRGRSHTPSRSRSHSRDYSRSPAGRPVRYGSKEQSPTAKEPNVRSSRGRSRSRSLSEGERRESSPSPSTLDASGRSKGKNGGRGSTHRRHRSPSPLRSPSPRPSPVRRRSFSPVRSRSHHRSPIRSRSRTPVRRRPYSRSRSRTRSLTRSSRIRRRSISRTRVRRRMSRSRSPPSENKVLGVFGLSTYTRERDLEDVFLEYGDVERVELIMDRQTGRSRGFGFVYFRTLSDAVRAKESTQGLRLHDRIIRVDYSKTNKPHQPTPGRYLGRKTYSSSRSSYSARYPYGYNGRRYRYFCTALLDLMAAYSRCFFFFLLFLLFQSLALALSEILPIKKVPQLLAVAVAVPLIPSLLCSP
ncbi:transformer-2 protein homolog beta-like isoform X2 [Zophobas morio]|uniref:transformer-2 protein homolog beta-like isoform X2 n=1 Tax=Zophobas morio TaxID=2755281 RepID=UPI0030831A2F